MSRVSLDVVLGSGAISKKSMVIKNLPTADKERDFIEKHYQFNTEIKVGHKSKHDYVYDAVRFYIHLSSELISRCTAQCSQKWRG